ncbi:hypothetical protein [Noviherbaspirillum denitrificans]|uniref:Uncharacterized protein n=1 Tax=Noviherbaspirillum denitrificans TaxID=1968433 RepID=A0A254TB75_9BURK|nr:hypothetical protein [Noviherbaspirillum denitrificans]OWW19891.1 hypothetical protein AYR66_10630 [Noviherbaspirillum denitrificans]
MATLIITDLAVINELGAGAMAAVRGGFSKELTGGMSLASLGGMDVSQPTMPANTFSVNASQLIGQSQSVLNNNGNNAAFVCGITSTVNPTQTGHNNINF